MKKKTWMALLCSIVMVLPVFYQVRICRGAEPSQKEREYVIRAKDDKTFEKISRQYEENVFVEGQVKNPLKEENVLVANLTEEQVHRLGQRDGVTMECNISLRGEGAAEPGRKDVKRLVREQWNLSAIQADSVKKVSQSRKIKVAILDSGVDYLSDISFDNQVSLIPGENTDDRTGHGSIIANLIAENENGFSKTGMIPEDSPIGLYNVRILDENNETTLSRVLQGLQWCIDNDMDVINMSFGTEVYSEILHQAVIKAEKAGILMVASVGNSGERGENILEYPAAYKEVIGVGSVNEKMEHSTFSNTGRAVELVAPGENIPVTSYWGLQGTGSGTSYAAAHVTGVSALLWAENPGKSPEEIRTLLDNSAEYIGEEAKYGYGMVNYGNASSHRELADKKKSIVQGGEKAPEMLQTYEVPTTLRASWGYPSHSKMIPSSVSGLSDHEVKVVKKAAEYADNSPNLQEYDVLHARGKTNYVSTAMCLYEAALAWKKGSNYSVLYRAADSYACREENDNIKAVNKQELKTAMRKAVSYNFQDMSQPESAVTGNRGKLQLLGLAIHVVGDTYAHKSRCDGSKTGLKEIESIYKNDTDKKLKDALKKGFQSIEEIKSAAKSKKGLTTSAMGGTKYFKNPKVCNKFYTDSVTYMGKRYSVATKVGTNKLLNYFKNKSDYKPYVFCPYEYSKRADYRKNYGYQTRHLTENIQDAGYNIFLYLNGQNAYTVNDWKALSYDE